MRNALSKIKQETKENREHIESEKILKEQKIYAESIVETLHEPLLVLNADLTVKSVNQAFYNHFKVNPKETIGQKIYHLGSNQWNIPELRKLLENVLPDNKVFYDYEVEHDFEDLGHRTMLVNARRLDHVQLILLGIRDISERKNHEKIMQKMLNVDQVGMLRFSDDANLLEANDSFLKMIGYTREEFEKEKPGWQDFTPAEFVEISQHQLEKLARTGKIGPYEKEYFKKDGSRKWMMFAGSSLGDGTFVEFCFDISGKKKAEHALAENEERLSLTLDAMEMGSWMREHNSEKLFIDEQNAKLFGFTGGAQSLKTDKIYEHIHPADRARIRQAVKNAWEKDGRYNEEFRVLVNGKERWLASRGKVVQDGTRKMIGINFDITERKKTQLELKKARDAAEEAALTKEKFLAHMSHEIRTPLNSIVGLSHLLLEMPHDEQQTKNLKTLKTASENLHLLINDILDYSKLRSGKWQIKPEAVDIRKCIGELAATHLPAATAKNISLKTNVDKNIPEMVMTDEPKLRHVLNNLVSNAVKFTGEGKVETEVKLNHRENNKLWLEFSVSDTGIGIKEKQLEHIFNEFSQADHSTAKQYKGTGLGLAIVKMYLTIMDSEINVNSTPGEGSRFWFVLPVNEGKRKKAEKPKQEKLLRKVDLKLTRVLIVEDDDFSRMMMSQMLKMWGIEHDEAENGKAGLELAKKNNYDIVYMDVHLPLMDGFEATRKIRKIKGYQNKPIFALTADVTDEITNQVKSGLFTGKTIKPFDPDKLLDDIKKCLGSNYSGE